MPASLAGEGFRRVQAQFYRMVNGGVTWGMRIAGVGCDGMVTPSGFEPPTLRLGI